VLHYKSISATAAYSAPSSEAVARFNYVAIFFHWIIAALIFANVLIAWQFSWVRGSFRDVAFQTHKSIGITVLLLSVLRIVWRGISTLPPFPETMRNWEKFTSKIVERGFYFIMLALPLTGWALVSASDLQIPTVLFGVIHWPDVPVIGTLPFDLKLSVYSASVAAHHALAKLTYALIALHVLAALRHQFIKRDHILARMIPFLKPKRAPFDLRNSERQTCPARS
jgi:cytochrome b561